METTTKKERDSNFELCRLACMLYIVIYHLIIHVPQVYESTLWGRPLRTLCHIGVVVFVMISGYFGIHRKWKRLLSLALSVSFYNALGILVAILIFNHPLELKSLLSVVFPITKGGYWFITSYAVLYVLAPYINMVLKKLTKKDFLVFLMVLAVVVWYGGGIWSNAIGHGRGILAFVFSYSIGYYIRKFYSEEKRVTKWGGQYFVVSAMVFAGIAFLPGMLAKAVNYLCFGYNEIGLYVMSILFLLMFQSIKIKSKMINWSAASCIGIYLCHGNINISSMVVYPLYKNFVYTNISNEGLLLISHIVFAIIFLVCCILIDKSRQYVFNIIFGN